RPYRQAADRILSGRFDMFALRGIELGFPPHWQRDPKTGTVAPQAFGKTLDYRNQGTVGDIKYLWEINRHYELVTLAQAFHLSGAEAYAVGCRRLLESWFEQSPYPYGQNWTSSLENAIRLLNWAVAWHLLGGDDAAVFSSENGRDFKRRWLDSVCQHCHFIAGHLSLHSSANNHLFGEYMGLFFGALNWPLWPDSGRWREAAQRGLEQQALRQNAADGVNREQAIWYQHEVADMMLLCALFGRANGVEFSTEYWGRLEAMLDFICSLMDAGGHVPMIGDSDDALMLRLSMQPHFDAYRSLLTSGAVLFGRADFKAKACIAGEQFDDKSRWLLGDAAAQKFAALPAQPVAQAPTPRRAFAEGGYYLLGSEFDTRAEIRIVADAGPLGYLSIAAHGHADALAFTLSAAGRPLLIDPGTYAYHTQQRWRDYFRGTAAHNTVRIDGLDQSEPGGNFMWLQQAHAVCERWASDDEEDVFVGSHDGYLRLRDPVLHRRKIQFRKRQRRLQVEDSLECHGAHQLEFSWHFAADCEVRISGRTVSVVRGTVGIVMTMPDCDTLPQLACGQENPPLGWTSPRLDEKQPSPSVVWRVAINGSATYMTDFRISIADGNEPAE
ncbi:MAG TPA: alginate lyase family protein, partial [Burkholderiaceae bacterium]|nr:alginate lyase family protein [Burkholderiaceae bacterium]